MFPSPASPPATLKNRVRAQASCPKHHDGVPNTVIIIIIIIISIITIITITPSSPSPSSS
eukprot:5723854-Pyramimonas_sp.AAC.1